MAGVVLWQATMDPSSLRTTWQAGMGRVPPVCVQMCVSQVECIDPHARHHANNKARLTQQCECFVGRHLGCNVGQKRSGPIGHLTQPRQRHIANDACHVTSCNAQMGVGCENDKNVSRVHIASMHHSF